MHVGGKAIVIVVTIICLTSSCPHHRALFVIVVCVSPVAGFVIMHCHHCHGSVMCMETSSSWHWPHGHHGVVVVTSTVLEQTCCHHCCLCLILFFVKVWVQQQEDTELQALLLNSQDGDDAEITRAGIQVFTSGWCHTHASEVLLWSQKPDH
ncbi:hypothetical protein SCLCIDRAFT_1214579, partial [Scleroderma citrinum Foug A]